CYFNNCPVG
uniref:Phasvatocin n=1 Tax=Scyliorhinus canicula TaxID=7830 RepID=OXYF_SCYCA|nr:RecName: Full=Phasvatocin [Scyliorhinus canicula]